MSTDSCATCIVPDKSTPVTVAVRVLAFLVALCTFFVAGWVLRATRIGGGTAFSADMLLTSLWLCFAAACLGLAAKRRWGPHATRTFATCLVAAGAPQIPLVLHGVLLAGIRGRPDDYYVMTWPSHWLLLAVAALGMPLALLLGAQHVVRCQAANDLESGAPEKRDHARWATATVGLSVFLTGLAIGVAHHYYAELPTRLLAWAAMLVAVVGALWFRRYWASMAGVVAAVVFVSVAHDGNTIVRSLEMWLLPFILVGIGAMQKRVPLIVRIVAIAIVVALFVLRQALPALGHRICIMMADPTPPITIEELEAWQPH